MEYPVRQDFVKDMEDRWTEALIAYWNQFPSHPRLGEYLSDNGFEEHPETPSIPGGKTYLRDYDEAKHGKVVDLLAAVDIYTTEKDALIAAIEAKKPKPPEPVEDTRTPLEKLQAELEALNVPQ